jgi:ribosomal protein L5
MNRDSAFFGGQKWNKIDEKGTKMTTFLLSLNPLWTKKNKDNKGLKRNSGMVFGLHIKY